MFHAKPNTDSTLKRALCIFDALLKAVEAAGLQVELTPPARTEGSASGGDRNDRERVTQLLCREECLGVRLFEGVDVELDPSPKHPRRRPGDPIWYVPPERPSYIYTPTGELALQKHIDRLPRRHHVGLKSQQ